MEKVEDIVIVGAGIAGLTTALGLHRLGLRSLVLESSNSLRITGFAFTTWTNAWRALDAVGLGDSLRRQHHELVGIVAGSSASGLSTSQVSFKSKGKNGDHEVYCVRRKELLEALEKELPHGTIRYSSKIVQIEESGNLKLAHLADGSILKAKVLLGCDGVNSVVAKWLGLPAAANTGRWGIRGMTEFPGGHGFEPKFFQFNGDFKSGFMPCDQNTVYWFFTWRMLSSQEKDLTENPETMKQFVLSKLGNVPREFVRVVENTQVECFVPSPLRYRWPFSVLWGAICRGNACVAGDALHPMTPDLGQGGCAALEDGVTLARCLAEAMQPKPGRDTKEEHQRIKTGLENYAKERRYRSFQLISTAYLVGVMQQSDGILVSFLRDKCLSGVMAGSLLERADFDCGKLSTR